MGATSCWGGVNSGYLIRRLHVAAHSALVAACQLSSFCSVQGRSYKFIHYPPTRPKFRLILVRLHEVRLCVFLLQVYMCECMLCSFVVCTYGICDCCFYFAIVFSSLNRVFCETYNSAFGHDSCGGLALTPSIFTFAIVYSFSWGALQMHALPQYHV